MPKSRKDLPVGGGEVDLVQSKCTLPPVKPTLDQSDGSEDSNDLKKRTTGYQNAALETIGPRQRVHKKMIHKGAPHSQRPLLTRTDGHDGDLNQVHACTLTHTDIQSQRQRSQAMPSTSVFSPAFRWQRCPLDKGNSGDKFLLQTVTSNHECISRHCPKDVHQRPSKSRSHGEAMRGPPPVPQPPVDGSQKLYKGTNFSSPSIASVAKAFTFRGKGMFSSHQNVSTPNFFLSPDPGVDYDFDMPSNASSWPLRASKLRQDPGNKEMGVPVVGIGSLHAHLQSIRCNGPDVAGCMSPSHLPSVSSDLARSRSCPASKLKQDGRFQQGQKLSSPASPLKPFHRLHHLLVSKHETLQGHWHRRTKDSLGVSVTSRWEPKTQSKESLEGVVQSRQGWTWPWKKGKTLAKSDAEVVHF